MPPIPEELFLRRTLVFVSALVYWAGVGVQARRIRKHIGRSPNVRPRGGKEKVLWAGWFAVILVWMAQPWLAGRGAGVWWSRLWVVPPHGLSLWGGLFLVVAGYVGTLRCYAAMGDAWRIGINRKEKNALVTRGPYRWVRHPIYLFQVVMLAGVALLLPTFVSLVVLVVHLVCVRIKTLDEEGYLLAAHGQSYRDYLSRTGRLLPK